MTKYNKSVREKMFHLYAQGIPMERIAKQGDVSKYTLYKWKKRYNWVSRKAEIEEGVRRDSDETLTQMKKRQLKSLRAMFGKYLQSLRDGKADVKTSDALGIIKQELFIMGEKEGAVNVNLATSEDKLREYYDKSIKKKKKGVKV